MAGTGRVEVITSKGCSRRFSDITCTLGTSSFRDLRPSRPSISSMPSATSSVSLLRSTSNSPFSGLVICVTGLSKEARKQVMDATEKLGGQYSPHLHPRCTHLVVQSSNERQFEYALKHGAADGLFIVTLVWFVDSVRRNVRLNESLYGVKSFGEKYMTEDSGNSCLPVAMLENAKQCNLIEKSRLHLSEEPKRRTHTVFSGQTFYIDQKDSNRVDGSRYEQSYSIQSSHKVNQSIAILAKKGVRNRRGRCKQTCQTQMKPSARSILLDSICWSISEPSSMASIYVDSFNFHDDKTSVFVDANESMKKPNASFVNFSRPLSESEKNELVFGNHFITILFPLDRFAEMGPCSRTFFSDLGFSCLQLLDHIYTFYQENMSTTEIELALHTDSRHADSLRSKYSSKEAVEHGFVELKRIDFLGSRKSFEMLKRVPGDNINNVYELLTRA